MRQVIEQSRNILGIPANYRVGIVPASDTGAVEMALWSLLGPRGVDILTWESFGEGWAKDVLDQLKLENIQVRGAEYGTIPDLSAVDFDHDVVFTWNGTTSGVRVPNADWIPADRRGLTICDATSAAFAMDLAWDKLDVTTWSWQKALGGEAQHGMIALSPRAVERLESHKPAWPMPKIFRLTKGGKLIDGVFVGETINTPSMLAVADAVDGLNWATTIGGLPALIKRSEDNLAVITRWVERTPGVDFLAADPSIRSCTSICVALSADWFTALDDMNQAKAAKRVAGLLDEQGVAHDIAYYRDAPPGLRIWGGATIEAADLEALCPWLDWAIATVKKEMELG